MFGKKKNENDAAEKHSFSDELPEMNAYDGFDPADPDEDDDFDQFQGKAVFKGKYGGVVVNDDFIHLKGFKLGKKVPYENISYVGIRPHGKKNLWLLEISVEPEKYSGTRDRVKILCKPWTCKSIIGFKEKYLGQAKEIADLIRSKTLPLVREMSDGENQGIITVDHKHQLLSLGFHYPVRFHDILGCDLLKDGYSVTSGNAGKALAGGVLFGPAGAIIGSAAKRTTVEQSSYSVAVHTNDLSRPAVLSNTTASARQAELAIATINIILEQNRQKNASDGQTATDPLDEIKKYKALLDENIITQEEFDRKKKELLKL